MCKGGVSYVALSFLLTLSLHRSIM